MMPGKILCVCLSVFLTIIACGPAHEHRGLSFVSGPEVSRFGAGWRQEGQSLVITAYFKSSIIGRTEYQYEQLDIVIPADAAAGSKLVLPAQGVSAIHRKGGEGGQRSSRKVSGTIGVSTMSDGALTLALDLIFSEYECAGVCAKEPVSYARRGLLSARKGYTP